jgi:hypothetical protein
LATKEQSLSLDTAPPMEMAPPTFCALLSTNWQLVKLAWAPE